MPTPLWFEETPVLGALPDDQVLDNLRTLGEESLALELELSLLTHPGPRHTFSSEGRQLLARYPWSHKAHVAGYLEPPATMQELLPIRSIMHLDADRSLLGERLTIGLDGFYPADYPGGHVHQVFFHFAADHQLDQVQRLHFNVTRLVEEGQPFLFLDQPLFVGLAAAEPGLDLRYLTLKVVDVCDLAFLEALELDAFRRGLRLTELPMSASDLASELAFKLTQKIRRGQPTIQEFCLGLDFATDERKAPLRTGTYVAAQIPLAEQIVWNWEEWRLHSSSGQIVSGEHPKKRFPFNYLLVTVDRSAPRSQASRQAAGVGLAEAQSVTAERTGAPTRPPGELSRSPCEHRKEPLAGTPPDLRIRVRVDKGNEGTRLRYTLHSESGRVALNHQEVAGPVFTGPPEKLQTDLLKRMEKLSDGFDTYDEALLMEEVDRRLASFGQNLYRELFPPEMRQLYRKIRDEVCSIQIVSDEPWIPWELVKPYDSGQEPHVDDDFFCLRYELTRWLAGGGTPAAEIHLGRLAAVHAGHVPGYRPLTTADAEFEIVTALARAHSGVEDGSLRRATHDELRRLLEIGGTHLIHIIAHGIFDLEEPDGASILLPDKRNFRSSDLTGPLTTRIAESRPLVFLNACLLGQQSFGLTRLGGFARAFLDAGCGAFLGHQWPVRDSLAVAMTRKLYNELEKGETFGQAARSARLHVRSLDPGSPTWSALTVYAHPNGRLVF